MDLPTLPPPPFLANITKNQPSAAKSALNQITEDKCFRPISSVQVYECTCLRCGYIWHTLQQTRPKTCPGKACHSTYWDRAPSLAYREGKRVKKANPEEETIAPRKIPQKKPSQVEVSPEDALPDIPVALLEAVDALASPDNRDAAGAQDVRPIDIEVEAPASIGAVDAAGDSTIRDTPVPAGQPTDDGRSEVAPVKASAPVLPSPNINGWETIGWDEAFKKIIVPGE